MVPTVSVLQYEQVHSDWCVEAGLFFVHEPTTTKKRCKKIDMGLVTGRRGFMSTCMQYSAYCHYSILL